MKNSFGALLYFLLFLSVLTGAAPARKQEKEIKEEVRCWFPVSKGFSLKNYHVSLDGKTITLLFSSTPADPSGQTRFKIEIRDLRTGELRTASIDLATTTLGREFSPDFRKEIVRKSEEEFSVIETQTGKVLQTYKGNPDPSTIQFLRNGSLTSHSLEKGFTVFDVKTGTAQTVGFKSVAAGLLSLDNRFFLLNGYDADLAQNYALYEFKGARIVYQKPIPKAAYPIAFSPDAKYFAYCASDSSIQVFRTSDGTKVFEAPVKRSNEEQKYDELEFTRDGKGLKFTWRDGIEKTDWQMVWDIPTQKLLSQSEIKGRNFGIAVPNSNQRVVQSVYSPVDCAFNAFKFPPPPTPPPMTPVNMKKWIQALENEDAIKVYDALGALNAYPNASLAALKELVPPQTLFNEPLALKKWDSLIEGLTNENYYLRTKADTELRTLLSGEYGKWWMEKIEAKMKDRKAPIDLKNSWLSKMKLPESPTTPDYRQKFRAIQALENLGTKESKSYLEELVKQSHEKSFTRIESEAALYRLRLASE